MSQSQTSYRPSDPAIGLQRVLRVLRVYRRRWLVPAVAIAAAAAAYAVFMSKQWEATQTLLVRDEAATGEAMPGRFRDMDEMKVTHETIMEMARSHRVLRGVLLEVGPAAGKRITAAWPTLQDVAELREAVTLTPPGGAEFGKTEISHLNVRDYDKQRAIALAAAVSKHLEAGLRRLRDSKAQSMIDEITKTVHMAERDLDVSTSRLAELERQVGPDLSDLRNMELNATGDSDLRTRLNNIEDELRQARAEQRSNQELRELLIAAGNDPGHLLATPSRLLNSQPALRSLKDGLVAAQLRSSQLRGKMTEHHPHVMAARAEERQIAQHLHEELAVAIRGVEVDLRLTTDRVAFLESQGDELRERLGRLAGLRPRYSTVLAEVKHRTDAVAGARRKLAVAQAAQAGARTASLITFVDTPILGDQPLGPSRATILLLGIFGGLATGFGLVFLTVPSLPPALSAEAQPHSELARPLGRAASVELTFPSEWTSGIGSKA